MTDHRCELWHVEIREWKGQIWILWKDNSDRPFEFHTMWLADKELRGLV